MSAVHKIHLGNSHRRKLIAKTRQLTENSKVRMHVCRRHPRVFVLQQKFMETCTNDNEGKDMESILTKLLANNNEEFTRVDDICVSIKAECANIDGNQQGSKEESQRLDVYACLSEKCTITPLYRSDKDNYKSQIETNYIDSNNDDDDGDDDDDRLINTNRHRITFIDCTQLRNSINAAHNHREIETCTQTFFLRNVETHELYLPCWLSVNWISEHDNLTISDNILTRKSDDEHLCKFVAVILDHNDLVPSGFDKHNNDKESNTKHIKELCFEVVTLSL